MPNLVAGFIWQPIDVGNRAARRKGRGLIGHVAVSARQNYPAGGTPATRPADWHFYLPKEGPGYQYIDLDLQSWSSGDANADTVAFESEGGLGDDAAINSEPFTENQLNLAAQILAHLHLTEGVPLRVMQSSAAGERGYGYHRLGINHSGGVVAGWRQPGTQSWSSKTGKLCPGDAKIAQAQEIVNRAAAIVGGAPAPAPSAPAPPAGVGFVGAHALPPWPLKPGHVLGDVKDPRATVHGGHPTADPQAVNNAIEAVQRLWIAAGLVPGVPASQWRTSGWAAGGRWDAQYSNPICAEWFRRFRPGQPDTTHVWADDYAAMRKQVF